MFYLSYCENFLCLLTSLFPCLKSLHSTTTYKSAWVIKRKTIIRQISNFSISHFPALGIELNWSTCTQCTCRFYVFINITDFMFSPVHVWWDRTLLDQRWKASLFVLVPTSILGWNSYHLKFSDSTSVNTKWNLAQFIK